MSKRKLVAYVISDVKRSLTFEAIAKWSKKWGDIDLVFVFVNSDFPKSIEIIEGHGIPCYWIKCQGKFDFIIATLKVVGLLKTLRPTVVHGHLFKGSLIGMLAARLANCPRAIITRHHSVEHHLYSGIGVLLDKLINLLTDQIIAISGVVSDVLVQKEGIDPSRIVILPHGFDLEAFSQVDSKRRNRFLVDHRIDNGKFIVGVISRFVEWKGVNFIVKAFKRVLHIYPDIHLVLMNAHGPHSERVWDELRELPQRSYTLIKFEEDICAAYAAFNCFIHTPVSREVEAFGQVYVEALAAGVPSIFSLSGIALDFIEDSKNALVVPGSDSEAISVALLRLLKERDLRDRLASNGKLSVIERFELVSHMQELRALYLNELRPKSSSV